MRRLLLVLAACRGPSTSAAPPPAPPPVAKATPDAATAPAATDDEKLAAIQKAMNELHAASQQCWAAAATERFDIAGDVVLDIDIGAPTKASIVRDTAQNQKLAACLIDLMTGYRWAPPLAGQSIELPFQFKAPDSQNTIDRQLCPWKGQGKVSVAVLLDQANSGNDAASMLEVAIAAGGTTGMRQTERTELWYFLGPATVGGKPVAAGDMVYVPKNGAREISAGTADVHAVLVVVPGGHEGSARAGALPTREVIAQKSLQGPTILLAAKAKTFGPATIYADESIIHDKTLAASVLGLPAGANVAEHVHANETEMLYMLEGGGTMTVAGTQLAVTPSSVVQVPKNTKHAFAASDAVRAVQIYTPAGPEQRFKKAAPK